MLDDEAKAILRALVTSVQLLDGSVREAHGLRARGSPRVAVAAPSAVPHRPAPPPQQNGAVSMVVHHPQQGGGGNPIAAVSFDIEQRPTKPVVDPHYQALADEMPPDDAVPAPAPYPSMGA